MSVHHSVSELLQELQHDRSEVARQLWDRQIQRLSRSPTVLCGICRDGFMMMKTWSSRLSMPLFEDRL
jgi:hypothetical protein